MIILLTISIPKTFKRFNLRFSHHRLPAGKMQFTNDHRFTHCQLIVDTNTPHDHFFQCSKTTTEKKQRLDSIEKILDKILSPLKLEKAIINNISLYYKYSSYPKTNQQHYTNRNNIYNYCIKTKQILDGVTSSAVK